MHFFKRVQLVPATTEEVWSFFSSPQNLARITPPDMDFRITSAPGPEIYPGMIITYKVKPVPGLTLDWMTEITQVDAPHYFVDEQRLGPYRLWHHEHHFKLLPVGVEMTDLIHYALPGGWMGKKMNEMYVRHRLNAIFDYRTKIIEELFITGPRE